MPKRPPLPEGTITRAEAAAILGIGVNKVSALFTAGMLQRATGRMDGRSWRHEVEALAAARLERRRRTEAMIPPKTVPVMPPDQEATFEELMAATEWTKDNAGPFVDSEGAAQILGVTPQYIGKLSKQGRLPWLPTGRLGGGATRVYRRTQLEVIARARRMTR